MLRSKIFVAGASNVALAMPELISVAKSRTNGPVDFHFACAHGRSYCIQTMMFVHSVPGILDSGLIPFLDEQSKKLDSIGPESCAIITDLGNDIFFGQSVNQIVDNVRQLIEKILPITRNILLMELPLETGNRCSKFTFYLFKLMLFPQCRLSLKSVLKIAEELNERLLRLAHEYELNSAKHDLEWYGFDPIHVTKKYRFKSWENCFDTLGFKKLKEVEPLDRVDQKVLGSSKHETRFIFRRQKRSPHPSAILSDQSRVSLF